MHSRPSFQSAGRMATSLLLDRRTMVQQVNIDSTGELLGDGDDNLFEIVSTVAYSRLAIANVVYAGHEDSWVLIDAGVWGSTNAILRAVENRFGTGSRPRAIVLTHGHFDHVGVLPELAERWDVPIYAHPLEHPYLNGSQQYP